jgi:sulfofructose kinase
MSQAHDVYAYGVVASSTLYTIKGEFPGPDGYAEVEDVQFMTGGEAANSSIVLSRLGVRVRLDGNWLGADAAGRRTRALLNRYRIDTSRLPLREGYRGVRETVFAARGTRTIFGTYGHLLEAGDWNVPVEDDIVRARVVSLDPFFGDASRRVAEIGFAAGIPVVTTDCRHDDPLLRHAAAAVIAESFIQGNYPDRPLGDLWQDYLASTDGLVAFTFGDREIRYGRRGSAAGTLTTFPVDAIDTTGAGDAFRAGVVYGFLQGWDDVQTIAFAAAVAAIVCTRTPGTLNAPDLDEVRTFMRSRGA